MIGDFKVMVRENTTPVWVEREIDLIEFENQDIYIAFRHRETAMNFVILDDVKLVYSPRVVSDDDQTIPTVNTALIGNFPNPFNPTTLITLSVGAMFASLANSGHGDMSPTTHVEINVYNVRGQRVRTLLNEYKEAGHYSVV